MQKRFRMLVVYFIRDAEVIFLLGQDFYLYTAKFTFGNYSKREKLQIALEK